LHGRILRRFFLSSCFPRSLFEFALLAARLGSGAASDRTINRTTAFRDVLDDIFSGRSVPEVTHAGVDTVLSACDLRSGAAVRFGSRLSACSRFGKIVDAVPVADAVAASAAYPLLLPTLHRAYSFESYSGEQRTETLALSDGGLYDNLALSVLNVDRDIRHTSHVYHCRYVLAFDAGHGQTQWRGPDIWVSRVQRSVAIMQSRAQHGERHWLYAARSSGRIAGFVYAYLGMQDGRLPVPIPDLVPGSRVVRYGTDFAPMADGDLIALSLRGEQLVRNLLSHYCPDLA
jgi:NTE family protein